jgi:adenine-specific DNA methylase
MIPKECKRLAEVDFPIAVVSQHSAREKSIRHGHPSTLHLWWARRPLAACRSMLMALLLPDPCDANCPAEFKTAARSLLAKMAGKIGATDGDLRTALLAFIGDFANWDNAANSVYLEVARGLVKAAHPEETPLVVDPFAGGGSIPLEALRLGCDAFASDLNPVACLICKVLLEDIPRHGPELAEELRRVGAEVKKAAEKELAEFYPVDPDGARPIAYLWARTVRCEAPNCGAEIPLVRSFWLCKKAERLRALRCRVKRQKEKGKSPEVEFEIFTPLTEKEVPTGSVSRAKATCVCCNTVLHPDRVRGQLSSQRGGADVVFDGKGRRTGGATLLAVVTLKDDEQGRHYRLANESDYRIVWLAQQALEQIATAGSMGGPSTIPNEDIPLSELRRISVPIYGVTRFRGLYTHRQLLCLSTLATRVRQIDALLSSCSRLLAMSVDKTADLNNALTRWKVDAECPVQTLARHDIGMAWDFAEAVPISDSSGSFASAYERSADSILPSWCHASQTAITQRADACSHPLSDESAHIWFTDPPYYDSIPYAHLSDFFYVWIKRMLVRSAQDVEVYLCPKDEECVVDRPHRLIPNAKTANVFESRIGLAMRGGARIARQDGISCIVFAHKTTEGWEALLSGLIHGGWTVRASWPITTEMPTRLNARDNASLSASVHLVCRPRPEDASIGDWAQVLRELPKRVADWMNRLQGEGIRGADLVFACIGPALEIYSRYSKVVDAEEREIPLGGDPEAREPHKRGYLAYVWEVVGRAALEQVLGTAEGKARNGSAGVLEEDARLTALFLWTLQSTAAPVSESRGTEENDEEIDTEDEGEAPVSKKKKKGLSLPFDVARRFAQPLGIHLDAWEGRCIETEKGVVRLISVLDRAKQLFGDDGAEAVADRLEKHRTGPVQLSLFAELNEPTAPKVKGRTRKGSSKVSDESLHRHRGATTLDHVHAAMLLQSSGRANALRALLKSETERGPDFLRLANALSALYPKDSDEKRLLDAMLLAVPR